jgi:hypothetical protein
LYIIFNQEEFSINTKKSNVRLFCICVTICFFNQYLISAEPELNLWEIHTIPTLDDPEGGISVKHGQCCLASDSAPIEDDESVDIPPWANSATVFLNGWYAKYLFGAQPVGELKIWIQDVEIKKGIGGKPDTLNWKAIGRLADNNYDNPYKFCYYYTVIFWDDLKIEATSYGYNNINSIHKNSGDDMPLLILPSYLKNLPGTLWQEGVGKKTAILPRGFEFNEGGGYCSSLLQIAYNIDHTENILENKPYGTSWIGSNFVSWDTQAVLKDSDDVLDYAFTDYVTALTGEGIDIIQPPFTISPQLSYYGWGTGSIGEGYREIQTEEPHIIEDVPFTYAIPVLAGWDLKYFDKKDHDILEMGVWIDDFEYIFDSARRSYSLKYKISYLLRDESKTEHQPGFVLDHKVNILGIKGTRHVPDLVPVPGWCTADYRQLGITVSNKEKVGAPSTTTTVRFKPGGVFDIWTPGIVGASYVTIPCAVPETCWKSQSGTGHQQCDFDIQVDSLQEVTETNEQNNNGKGSCLRDIPT